MLKVVIVDDEPIIVMGLRKLIKWDELGLNIVGEARDGEEALEIVSELMPDIIITDLLMPGIDGIQFIRKLKETSFSGKIIILSGHSEFEYAREALKNNVFEYLLKPVTASQLADTLLKVQDEIMEQKNRCYNLELLNKKLKESMPVLREKFFWELFHGEYTKEKNITDMLSLLSIDLNGAGYVVMCIDIENLSQLSADKWDNSPALLKFAIKNVVEELTETIGQSFVTQIGNRTYILLVECEQDFDEKVFLLANKILENLKSFLNVEASIGIGNKYDKVSFVKNSFEESEIALKHKFLRGKGSIIHIGEASLLLCNDKIDNSVETEILEGIKYKMPLEPEKAAQKLILQYLSLCGDKIELIYSYCYDFLVQLRKLLDSDELIINPISRGETLNNEIISNSTQKELEKWISKQLELSLSAISAAKKMRENDVIADSKDYIDKHFAEQLTLNKIASKVYMSPTHFCTLFKTRLGIGFHDYLMKVRMEHAVKLILGQTYKIYEVADQVGYKNPRYFSEAFKRYYGVIPTEYKIE